MNGDFYVQLQGLRVTVNPYSITPKDSVVLNEKMTEAKINISMYSKVRPEDGEKKEDWIKRYNEAIKAENEKLKEESAADFIKRAMGDGGFKDNQEYMYSCLKAIAETFNQPEKVTRDGFENSPIVLTNNFIFNVCKKAKVPCPFALEIDELANPEY